MLAYLRRDDDGNLFYEVYKTTPSETTTIPPRVEQRKLVCSLKPLGEPFVIQSKYPLYDLKRHWKHYTKKIEFPHSLTRIGVHIGDKELFEHQTYYAAQLYEILKEKNIRSS